MWYRALALSVLCLWPAISGAQVVFDATNAGGCGSCSSVSWSHTTAAGSNLGIFVGGHVYEGATAYDSISGVTHNSVALTLKCNNTTSGAVPHKDAGWWYLANPATGIQTIVVTASGIVSGLGGGSISASGVNQSTPMGACATATGSSTTPSVNVTSATNDLVVDAGTIDHTGTLTVGAGQTERWNFVDGSGSVKFFSSTEPGAASVTMSWTNSIGTPEWIVTGSSLVQASGGGVASIPSLMLLGVGN